MIATSPGQCENCGGPILTGYEFQWGEARGSREHVDCAEAFAKMQSGGEKPTPQPQAIHWSKYQQALFDFAQSDRSGIVNAVAGSGKTTAIEEFCRRLPDNLSVKYLVFNRRNADEAKKRMPRNVDASTFHSSCFSALKASLEGPVEIDELKVYRCFDAVSHRARLTRQQNEKFRSPTVKLVRLGKNAGIGTRLLSDTPDAWLDLAEHYGVYPEPSYGDDEPPDEEMEKMAELASHTLKANNRDLDTIDFDDMLYLTVLRDVPLPRYDVVCVDEAQDTNSIQQAILERMVKPGGRLIAVGDPRQAIYGFRGSLAGAMPAIAETFDCVELPLSINYRCSRAVIERAQHFCPEIEAHDGAPEGSVELLTSWSISDFEQTDAILCRYNAPIVSLAYALMSEMVPCTVLGRDIGKGLISLIKKVSGRGVAVLPLVQFNTRLEEYRRRELLRFNERTQAQAQAFADKVSSIRAIADGLPPDGTTADLSNVIERMFSDDGTDRLTLSTVHKAKGLEWKRVFVLEPDAMPSKWAKKGWQLEQERNLIYVAYTRAKVDLYFLPAEALQ